jgi:hypothetical protein
VSDIEVLRPALGALAAVCSVAAGAAAAKSGHRAAGVVGAAASLALFAAGGALGLFRPAPLDGALAFLLGATVLGKTAMLRHAPRGTDWRTGVAFVLVWPGTDVRRAFARDASQRRRGAMQLLRGVAEIVAMGVVQVTAAATGFSALGPVARWAADLAAFVLLLDGSCAALTGALRAAGFAAEDLFREPWRLASLADFWGRRWNLFVGRVLHDVVFVPSRRRLGAGAAVLAAFLASGVFHEVIFGLPGGEPFGRYTAFFLIQGAAMLTTDRRLPAGWPGRVAALAVLLGASPLFFNASFRAIFG